MPRQAIILKMVPRFTLLVIRWGPRDNHSTADSWTRPPRLTEPLAHHQYLGRVIPDTSDSSDALRSVITLPYGHVQDRSIDCRPTASWKMSSTSERPNRQLLRRQRMADVHRRVIRPCKNSDHRASPRNSLSTHCSSILTPSSYLFAHSPSRVFTITSRL